MLQGHQCDVTRLVSLASLKLTLTSRQCSVDSGWFVANSIWPQLQNFFVAVVDHALQLWCNRLRSTQHEFVHGHTPLLALVLFPAKGLDRRSSMGTSAIFWWWRWEGRDPPFSAKRHRIFSDSWWGESCVHAGFVAGNNLELEWQCRGLQKEPALIQLVRDQKSAFDQVVTEVKTYSLCQDVHTTFLFILESL